MANYDDYHPVFTEGYKKFIRERDNFTCQLCGITEAELRRAMDVHHIDGNKMNCSPNDLISVCPYCHGKVSGSKDKEKYRKILTEKVKVLEKRRKREGIGKDTTWHYVAEHMLKTNEETNQVH